MNLIQQFMNDWISKMERELPYPPARIFKGDDGAFGVTPSGWNQKTKWFPCEFDARLFFESFIHREEPKVSPICPDCGREITGTSYNGRCGPCSRQAYREEQQAIEDHWREANEP